MKTQPLMSPAQPGWWMCLISPLIGHLVVREPYLSPLLPAIFSAESPKPRKRGCAPELLFPSALLLFQHSTCLLLTESSPQLDPARPRTLAKRLFLNRAKRPFNTTANGSHPNLPRGDFSIRPSRLTSSTSHTAKKRPAISVLNKQK